jgi:hypothetical protein
MEKSAQKANRNTLKALTRTLILLLMKVTVSFNSLACQCIPFSFDDQVNGSELIFRGRVVEADHNIFTFEILEVWKGEIPGGRIEIIQGETSCERRTFELNTEYLIYLSGHSVENCNRSSEFNSTVDPDRLDLLFRNIGNEKLLDGEQLTARELIVLNHLLKKGAINRLPELEESKIMYVLGESPVKKRTFLENYQFYFQQIELKKVQAEAKPYNSGYDYILWVGYNSKKSFRKIRRMIKAGFVP